MATSTTNYLTEDLITKILSGLPVKHLFRCKLVCKQWLAITLDPDFIQTHLTNSHKRPSVLTSATVYDQTGSFYQTVSLISNSFEDSVNIPVPSSCPAPDHSSTSCNGLVCLTDIHATKIYLWNPSTRQGKLLPYPKIKEREVHLVCIGFYFDSLSNDYKILKLLFFTCLPPSRLTQYFRVRVELYSTKSDSWIEIQVGEADLSSVIYGRYNNITSGLVIKRVLYMNGSHGPISFQLDNKVLKPVPLPSNCRINRKLQIKRWEPKVFDFQGCAALILQHDNDELLSLWALDDDEDGCGVVSWTKKFNLEADLMKNWTSIYFGVGQLIASEDYKRIILYNHRKEETKTHRLQLPDSWYIDSFYRHTESLVSVSGFSKL